jgi:hypothetical protein
MKLTATQSKFKQIGQSATALRAVRASPPITLTGELPMNRGVNRTAYIAAWSETWAAPNCVIEREGKDGRPVYTIKQRRVIAY